MNIIKFEDVISWQKSKELSLYLYNLLKSCRDYGFRDQLQRASVSIMNNIAEGFERRSSKELINFLYISKGSCGEVRSMLYLALELKYINKDEYLKCNNYCLEISRLLAGFIKSLYN
jgi:four helix bundle protein